MLVRVENSWTVVTTATEAEQDWLDAFLSFKDTKAEIRARAGYARGDGRVKMTRKRRGGGPAFPTGLLPIVQIGASGQGIRVDVVDSRGAMDFDADRLAELSLPPWNMDGNRDYQGDAIQAFLDGGASSNLVQAPLPGRGIIWAPTASGKGRIAAAVPYVIPGQWVFAVHRGHLAQDVRERWNSLAVPQGEPPAGWIGEGEWKVGPRLTCATLQSLYAHKGSPKWRALVKGTVGLVIDEAHTAPAQTFLRTIQGFTNARWRLGLSGTPLDRSDKRSMVALGALGPIVYRIRAKPLQERGVLAVPTVRVVPVYQRPAAPQHYGDWPILYQTLVVESTHRNGAVMAAVRYAMDKGETPGMVFVRSLDHGRRMTRMIERAGYAVRFVSGSTNTSSRKNACDDLRRGRLDFIVATKVFTEGVDVPELRTVINAQGGKSVIDTLQQTGRGMRVTADKKRVTVWEFGDKGTDMLNGHAKARIAAYQREGYSCVVDRGLWPEK